MMLKDIKICIIGAGPAGLSAAEALYEKGYRDITIFEKRNRVGGQSLSLKYQAKNDRQFIYEVGSLQPVSSSVGIFNKLLNRYKMNVGKNITDSRKALFVKICSFKNSTPLADFSVYWLGKPLSFKNFFFLVNDLIKLSWSLFKYRQLSNPGYTEISDEQLKELSQSYSEWLTNQKLFFCGDMLNIAMGNILTFSNSKLNPKIPAIKIIKQLHQFLKFPPRYVNGKAVFMKEGYQELWNRVAEKFNIRLNTTITKIKREDSKIIVEFDNEKLIYDKLIIACPPDRVGRFLELTLDEQEIFSKIEYAPGWRAAFIAKGLPNDAIYNYIEPYINPDYPIRLSLLIPEAQIDKDTWLYTVAFSHPSPKDYEAIMEETKKFVKEYYGGEIIEWLNSVYWSEYDPYFNVENTRAGIYKRFESLQSKNDTFYTGSVISGSSHPIVVNYSYQLIGKYF